MTQHHRRPRRGGPEAGDAEAGGAEQGSSAVEFALVFPVLLLIVVGIIEFGLVFNSQLQVTAAARDAARVISISAEPAAAVDQARSTAVSAAPTVSIDPATVHISVAPAGTAARPCPPGSTATVTIKHPVELLTGLMGQTLIVTGTGVMQCGV